MTGTTVIQGDRAKALRPLPRAARLEALDRALDAWARGDWFETHELLEPAWMGTADPAERDVYQGLIKLAAAFVHRERGNRAGMAKNLAGAQERLARAARLESQVAGLDTAALERSVAGLLDRNGGADLAAQAPAIARSAA